MTAAELEFGFGGMCECVRYVCVCVSVHLYTLASRGQRVCLVFFSVHVLVFKHTHALTHKHTFAFYFCSGIDFVEQL